MPPVLVAELFPGERAALLALLDTLSPAEWAAPTACAGWSVHEVALHIWGGDVGILSSRRDGYRESLTAVGDLSNWDTLVAFINERNAAWVAATRRVSPPLLCDFLRLTGAGIAAHFAALDPFAVGGAVNWAGPEPAPVWLDTAREYTERWVHQQHIRDAVDMPGLTEPHWHAPVLSAFVRALPRALHSVAVPEGTTVCLTITGEAGGMWSAVRQDGDWQLVAGCPTMPDAAVTMDAETAWRLCTRGLDDMSALQDVRCVGDVTLTAAVLRMVSIIA